VLPITEFSSILLLHPLLKNQEAVFFRKDQIIYVHGDRSDSMFYIEKGSVKLTVTSANGKEQKALIFILADGNFFGEGCLASNRPTRFYSASAVTDMHALKLQAKAMKKILRTNAQLAYALITHLLARSAQIQEEPTKNLLSSSEDNLVRVLSSVAQLGRTDKAGPGPRLSQKDLDNIIDASRQRMNLLIKRGK